MSFLIVFFLHPRWKGLRLDSYLEDETGKRMPAIKVFALSIQCLKDKLEEKLESEGTGKSNSLFSNV